MSLYVTDQTYDDSSINNELCRYMLQTKLMMKEFNK